MYRRQWSFSNSFELPVKGRDLAVPVMDEDIFFSFESQEKENSKLSLLYRNFVRTSNLYKDLSSNYRQFYYRSDKTPALKISIEIKRSERKRHLQIDLSSLISLIVVVYRVVLV